MATQSIKSDALEPDLSDLRGKGAKGLLSGALRLLPVYGLVLITLLLIVIFSVLLPDTFFTWMNARLILSNQSGTALLALAAMIPMVAGKIDLSIGYGVVLWEVLAISLQMVTEINIRRSGGGDSDIRGFSSLCERQSSAAQASLITAPHENGGNV